MRLTLRTTMVIAAMLASACSSLGGVDLHEGAEGRFTAGDDGDPTSPASGGAPSTATQGDESDGSSGFDDGDGPLEPPPPDDDDTDGRASDSDSATDGTDDGSAADSGTDDDDGSSGSVDDGTTSGDPQTNGAASIADSGETGSDGGECTDLECLPPCDRQWATWCDQPCDDVAEPTACATEGGIVVSCDMGVWTCLP